jgi:acyl carrier protein
MMAAESQVLDEVTDLMTQLAGDWEYTGRITPETRLLADLAMESLDLVVLGTALQERYGRLPFAEFLAEIGQRPATERDVSVGELVAFLCRNDARAAGGGR